ncbi:hypothetical protein VTN00DRAFT_5290 [Thermoascus crustaceus]|uniref:uncharacterized protein n=1 Tax=Thermoascus crustaceus TaxID=5088 RepID=UPI0037446485
MIRSLAFALGDSSDPQYSRVRMMDASLSIPQPDPKEIASKDENKDSLTKCCVALCFMLSAVDMDNATQQERTRRPPDGAIPRFLTREGEGAIFCWPLRTKTPLAGPLSRLMNRKTMELALAPCQQVALMPPFHNWSDHSTLCRTTSGQCSRGSPENGHEDEEIVSCDAMRKDNQQKENGEHKITNHPSQHSSINKHNINMKLDQEEST